MQIISIQEASLYVTFLVRDNGVVELAHFTVDKQAAATVPELKPEIFHPILEIQETGRSTRDMHGYKHNQGSASLDYLYQDHSLEENEAGRLLTIHLATVEGVRAAYHMQFFTGIPVVRVWTELWNDSRQSIPIEYISSFLFRNLCGEGQLSYFEKTDILIPRNSWYTEAQWTKSDVRDLNLTGMPLRGYNCPGHGMNEFSYDGKSSWSTIDYLPMGMVMDRETGECYIFQLEHSGQWHVEYGSDFGGRFYVALSGATEQEHGWWIRLEPGSRFTTIPAAFGVVRGNESDAVAALTRYRRCIRRKSPEGDGLPVVFNDYMNCLMGDPHEASEKRIIDLAAAIGCEYYCLDAGWYDSGYWWDRVGEWMESPERFPNGLRSVYEYARSKGLKMGMWLEIEVMGTECPLAKTLPDDWFVCRHGRRHVDNKRYLLDFRNPEVRKYCDGVIDRLVSDYGCEYFKIDYNVSMGCGSDLGADSCAQAMREHYECLYEWYRGVFKRHPHLVIENCGSGGQRMDYGMLRLLSLQSISDQTDTLWNSFIAVNAASAVAPEQAGMWVYPYENDREHVIYNMVNGLLLRPYISGKVWDLSPENLALLSEGIALYKTIRRRQAEAVPFFPLGFANTKDSTVLAYGLRHPDCIYLAVLTPFCEEAEIPLCLEGDPKEIRVIYPSAEDCRYRFENNTLRVIMPQKACARLFQIRLR